MASMAMSAFVLTFLLGLALAWGRSAGTLPSIPSERVRGSGASRQESYTSAAASAAEEGAHPWATALPGEESSSVPPPTRTSRSLTSQSGGSSSSSGSSSGGGSSIQAEKRRYRATEKHARKRRHEPVVLTDYGASSLRKDQAKAAESVAEVAAIRDRFRRNSKFRTFAAATSTSALPWCAYYFTTSKCKKAPCSWNAATAFARFDMFGCLQVSGIHVVQTHLKTIVILDRSDSNNTLLYLPNTTQSAYAEELTLGGPSSFPSVPFSERALDVKSNVFCSAGQVAADGTVYSIGGSSDAIAAGADVLLNGSFSIREFKPCSDNTCDFDLNLANDLTSKRWYTTAQIMPSGRILIVGGANTFGNIAMNTFTRNNPTIEFYPRRSGEGSYVSQFLTDSLPFNLYPFVHLLPSGLIYIFAGYMWTLWDPSTQSDVVRARGNPYPPLNVTGDDNSSLPLVVRSYPDSGTSVLFPLSSSNNYLAEVMVCGGNRADAVYLEGGVSDKDRALRRKLSTQSNPLIPADYRCYRITPEAANPTWTLENMCKGNNCTGDSNKYRRVMADAVLLADGNVLILNGAQQGYQGLNPKFANTPQLQPLIYLPSSHTWYPTSQLPASLVPRMYHSSAILLHDATVLITGSNPNAYIDFKSAMPTELRVERFIPPYLMTNLARPVFVSAPATASVGSTFNVVFTAAQASSVALAQRFTVALSYPGFSTHNQRQGMRHVWLDVKAVSLLPGSNNTYQATVAAPPRLTIAPPTMYWMHLLVNNVPAQEAVALKILAA